LEYQYFVSFAVFTWIIRKVKKFSILASSEINVFGPKFSVFWAEFF